MATSNGLIGVTAAGVFLSGGNGWKSQPGLGLGDTNPAAATQTVVDAGAQINYPRSSLITMCGDRLWAIGRGEQGAYVVLHSDSQGARWATEPIPTASDVSTANAADVPPEPATNDGIRAAQPPRIRCFAGVLYLIATSDVWEGAAEPGTWNSIGLHGLPEAQEGLPPAIRNYLPRTVTRPFELLTVLADQLMIFRRSERDDPWVLTHTTSVADRQLLGLPESEVVFLVAHDSLLRSDDQGESWFPFWPEGHPRIEVFLLTAASEAAHIGLAGCDDGSIWRSVDSGATWTNVRAADADLRSITALARFRGRIFASTLGQGVVASGDGGKTWDEFNTGLHAARPLDAAFSRGGSIVVATRAGLYELSGQSGQWIALDRRATTAVGVNPVSSAIVSGTLHGNLIMHPDEGEATSAVGPFADQEAFSLLPHQLGDAQIYPETIVAITARDDGRRWLGWSHRRGVVASEDGGADVDREGPGRGTSQRSCDNHGAAGRVGGQRSNLPTRRRCRSGPARLAVALRR